ncbi:hypothetical protein RFI_28336 [Reticulomyxa filosa]|uniref:Uncharacterized protein n=1 Tax=Reticulomyxa filosa TaxID=46433 RepID=X6M5X6_RETFI|nr:hypothetical protein RFI_28336 [Reticulomyxa filosa]|eukprot:ETO09051.1 hypothetical protein RFI_28336 [Reticulomyxa filosa]
MFPENKKMKDSQSSFELNIVRPLSLKKRAGKPKRNIFPFWLLLQRVDQVYLIVEEEENDNELNSNSISKSHLDKSCNLIPIKHIIPLEIVMSEQIETLQNMKLQIMENKKQIKKMKENDNKQIEELNVNSFIFQIVLKKKQQKQMNNVKADVLKKDKQIIGLTNDIQQLKTKINQLLMI